MHAFAEVTACKRCGPEGKMPLLYFLVKVRASADMTPMLEFFLGTQHLKSHPTRPDVSDRLLMEAMCHAHWRTSRLFLLWRSSVGP